MRIPHNLLLGEGLGGGGERFEGRKRVGKKYDKLAGLFGLCLSVQLLLLEDQVDASMDDRLAVLRRR